MPTLRMTTAIFSAEYWERKNPILLRGERGLAEFYDEDGHLMRIREKVGDGVMGEDGIITGTRWNDLPWFFNGLQGEKGDTGPMPRHDWKGTALRFENADGTWGERVDLKGEPGNRVNAEPATTTTLGGVMPATGLRVDIEGYEYVALGWDRHACYPDPIVVLHDDSAWLWLQKSGVGTDAGVRVPGTDAAAQYWRRVANVADIPGPGIGLSHNKQLNVYDVKYGNASGTALEGNGTALAAKKLETPRAITVNVGSPYGAAFDGTKDIQPGVTGVLPISNGGTGANNLSSLAQALAGTGQLGGRGRVVFSAAYEGSFGYYVKIDGLTPGKRLMAIKFSDRNDREWDNGFKGYGFTSCIFTQLSGLMFGTEHLLPETIRTYEYQSRYSTADILAAFDSAAARGVHEGAVDTATRAKAKIFFQISVLDTGTSGSRPMIAAPTVRMICRGQQDWGGYFRIYEI